MSENFIDAKNLFKAPFEIISEESKFILKTHDKIFSLEKSLEYDSLKLYTGNVNEYNQGVEAYTIVGVAEGKQDKYLIAATKTKFVGKILNSSVFKIEEVFFFI